MSTLFFATTNPGKQHEITRFAMQYAPQAIVRFPLKETALDVAETGSTFQQNALIKAQAYQQHMQDSNTIFVGDDSGIKIPALNNEPGVRTHRWAGREMADTEIMEYCLKKMHGLKGDDRKAVFETTLVVIKGDEPPKVYTGQMWGHILEKPVDATPLKGFPFRSIFWVDVLNIPIYQLHDLSLEQRQDFFTHREAALKALFEDLQEER